MQTASSKSRRDRTLGGATRFGLVTSIGTLVFAFLVMLTEQAGVPRQYGLILTAALVVSGIVVVATQTRTMSLADWMVAGRNAGATVNAMALAASIVSGWTLVMIAGQFFAESGAATAWIAGPLLGVGVTSIIVTPFMRKSGAITPAEYVSARFDDRRAGTAFAAAAIAAGVLLLWSHLVLAGSVAGMLLRLDRQTATMATAILIGIAVLPGGLRGMIRINAIIFAFLATAYLAPLIWLSASLTGMPIPQLSFGYGALGEIASVESELAGHGLPTLADQVDGAALAGIGPSGAMALGVFIAAGLCAMPFVLGHFPAARTPERTRISGGRAIIFVAMVLTAAPALAALAKLALYNNLLGLTAGDTIAGAEWILSWGDRQSVSQAVPMAQLCGKPVTDTAAAIAACGGNADHVIGPADVRLSAETVTLAFARMIGLPLVFGALIGASVVAGALASANAVAFSIAATASRDLLSDSVKRAGSSGVALFAGRLAVVLALAASAWLAVRFAPDPLETAMWALAIGAAVLTPALAGAIWWDRMNWLGAVAGMTAGSGVLLLHGVMAVLGMDMRPGSGDEFVIAIPGLTELPAAFHAAALALPVAIAAIVWISLHGKSRADAGLLDALRLPDADQAIRGPEV